MSNLPDMTKTNYDGDVGGAFEKPPATGVRSAGLTDASAQPAVPAASPAPSADGGDLQHAMVVEVDASYPDARKQAIADFERVYVQALLERTGGNVSRAAREAKMDRVYLHRLIRKQKLRDSGND